MPKVTGRRDLRESYLSSNCMVVEEGDVVLYSDGRRIHKCIVKKITTHVYGLYPGEPSGFHLEVIDITSNKDIGHKFVATVSDELWVLEESGGDAMAALFI